MKTCRHRRGQDPPGEQRIRVEPSMVLAASRAEPSRPVRQVGRMQVESYASREDMAAASSAAIAATVRQLLAAQPAVDIIFTTTPNQTKKQTTLAAAPGIDWARVTAFHMDEYV